MNICILTRATLEHQMGGTQVHCQILGEGAVQKGHAVTIVTTRHPRRVEFEQKNGCKVYYLQNTESARLSKTWWREGVSKIVQLHKKDPFDIIWAENLSGYYYAWKVKPMLKIPIISIIQGLGILGHIASEWNCISSFKEFFSFAGKRLPKAIFFYFPWFLRTMKYSDAVVGISDQTVEALKKEFCVGEEKIFVVYDGIDTEIFKPDEHKKGLIRKRFSLNGDDKIILMAGVVHKQKGMYIGLKAFVEIKKKLPEAKAMIVGDGPQLNELKALAKSLGIDQDVIWCGPVSNEQMACYYNAADIFVNPTVRAEGLSIVTVEAMSCGLPAVVSRIGGTQSIIDDGVSGFFVKPKDVKSLTEKTIEVLSDPVYPKKWARVPERRYLRNLAKKK